MAKAKKVIKKKVTKKRSVKKTPKKHPSKVSKKAHSKKDVERVPTGVKGFDKLIEGGFEKDSTNLVVGASGSGKSIFGFEFLLEGIRRGESCLYVTFEENKESFYDNLAEIGYDLYDLEKKGKFHFLEYTPQKVKTMLEEGGGAIETIVLSKKIERIVLDSATSLMLLFDSELEKKEAALSLFNLLKDWKCTSIIIYEESPTLGKDSSRMLDLEADAIILLYLTRGKKRQRERFVEVVKMRGTDHSLKIHPFAIKKGGIFISSRIKK